MPFQSTSFQTEVQPCKDLIDYHCITHRFGHASHRCAMPPSLERILIYFSNVEQKSMNRRFDHDRRVFKSDVEIFSVILGKISAQPWITIGHRLHFNFVQKYFSTFQILLLQLQT